MSAAHEAKSVLEWNLNEFFRQDWSFLVLESEGNLILELLPYLLVVVKSNIVHVTLFSEHFQYLSWLETSQSVEEESGLLSCKPFSQVFVSAVRKSANEVTDIVVLLNLVQFLEWNFGELLGLGVILSLDVELVGS